MFGSLFDKIVDTAEDFLDDPINTSVNIATSPLRNSLDVVDGLTEGELRLKAIASLGSDIAGDMLLEELIDWHNS
jgi:hypothetical protein